VTACSLAPLGLWHRGGFYCWEGTSIMGLIIALLVIWLAFVVIGFAVKALLWLAIVGIVLFIATGIFGAIRRRTS
jgi:hypothetical protein